MRHLYRSLVSCAALGSLLAACADAPSAPNPSAPRSLDQAITQGNADYVARGIASALASRDNRARLHAALRASQWMDRKVLLHEFVRTEGGAALLADAARGVGTSTSALQSMIDQLGPMDLYVPFADHRRSWHVEDEVLVAVAFDGDAPTIEARDALGAKHTLRLVDGTPKTALVILHAAEPKIPVGPVTTTSKTLFFEQCDPEFSIDCGGSSEPPPAPLTPGIYLTHFHSFRNDGWFGGLEMKFTAYAFNGHNIPLGNGMTGIAVDRSCPRGVIRGAYTPHQDYNQLILLVANVANDAAMNAMTCDAVPAGPHGLMVDIWEVDNGDEPYGLNGDHDFMGNRVFAGPSLLPWGARIGVNEPYADFYGTAAMLKLEYRP